MAATRRERDAVLARLADLLAAVGRPHVVRVAIDGFHRPRAERYRRGQTSPEGYYLDSFDHGALRRELLEPLGPGGSGLARLRVFDLHADQPVEEAPQAVPADAVLLFDGVFLLRPELNDLWDLRIYVEVDPDQALQRAVLRDEDLFGSPDEALRRYRNRYVPGQRLYLGEVDPRALADVVFENTDPASPALRASSPL